MNFLCVGAGHKGHTMSIPHYVNDQGEVNLCS